MISKSLNYLGINTNEDRCDDDSKSYMRGAYPKGRGLDAEVERAIKWAETVLDGVDRSRLGAFASDKHIVAATYASLFAEYDEGLTQNRFTGIVNELKGYATKIRDAATPSEVSPVLAEAWFWRCVLDGVDLHSDIFMLCLSTYRMIDHFNLFVRIYENPTRLPFYEVGIWDEDFIRQCFADDIDAAMAKEII